jgi:GDPmannose 4,6-dehydratase
LKKALVVGCKGQDGSYLVEHLGRKGYAVAGVDSGVAQGPLPDGRAIDIQANSQVLNLIRSFTPDEVYYLAAFHHSSEDLPLGDDELIQRSFAINTGALNNFLHAIATGSPHSRLFYAASSHVFGYPPENVQDENTPLNPVDAYGISKTAGVHLCRYYRNLRKIYCSVGILYNHESPRRSTAFVSRKVVRAAVRISRQIQDKLVLGDLDTKVDWGYAPDYVDAMWRILQLAEPEDFVISSGALHSVRDLVQAAFDSLGLDWTRHVEVDPNLTRKKRAGVLQGNSARLEFRTGWRPSMPFREMILEMVRAEMQDGGIAGGNRAAQGVKSL